MTSRNAPAPLLVFLSVTARIHHAALPAVERFKNLIKLRLHVLDSGAAVHNEVGASALLGIRQLALEQMFEQYGRPIFGFREPTH